MNFKFETALHAQPRLLYFRVLWKTKLQFSDLKDIIRRVCIKIWSTYLSLIATRYVCESDSLELILSLVRMRLATMLLSAWSEPPSSFGHFSLLPVLPKHIFLFPDYYSFLHYLYVFTWSQFLPLQTKSNDYLIDLENLSDANAIHRNGRRFRDIAFRRLFRLRIWRFWIGKNNV